MIAVPEFTTLDDARTHFLNSGVANWEWFSGFDEADFVNYLYRNANGETVYNDLIRSYLTENGENPADYNL